jgi:alpha-L-fucosidase 2
MKFLLTILVLVVSTTASPQSVYELYYTSPAKKWTDALPLGNGRIGAMVWGHPLNEKIQLNEVSLWTGGPDTMAPNPTAYRYLSMVREKIIDDRIDEAVADLKKMQGPDTEMYQPLGDVYLNQHIDGSVSDYNRILDIESAVSTVNYQVNGIDFKRTQFISAPHNVMVIRWEASKMKSLEFTVKVDNQFLHQAYVNYENDLVLTGKARINNDQDGSPTPFIYEDMNNCYGMRYRYHVRVQQTDGIVTFNESDISVKNASYAVLIIGAATSFNGFDKCPDRDGKDEVALVKERLKAVKNLSYTQLSDIHIKDYHKYFKRVDFSINNAVSNRIDLIERLQQYKNGQPDPALEILYYQFGRYLTISASRPESAAMNLQGLWNENIRPPWRSNYTVNINLQMNYWPALMTHLQEFYQPLIEQVKNMSEKGKSTAAEYYRMRGWTAHHNSDIWAQTNPVGEGNGDPKWANWSLGGAWLSDHLFEYFEYTLDTSFLRQVAYPVLRSAAEFCEDWLYELNGYYVTIPSTSPENTYIHPKGYRAEVTAGSAMDRQLIIELFENLLTTARVLNIKDNWLDTIARKKDRIKPIQIGKKGNIIEWLDDWQDEDPHHRHVSQLYGLHPANQISPLIDEKIAAAAKTTLELRGDAGTGWSKAWKINFWARLWDGNRAYKLLQDLLKQSTLNNLFDTHPPFQIDGNFGATSGITEMLLQSQTKQLHILPALPDVWKNGFVTGLKAKGNLTINIYWKDNKLTELNIFSPVAQTIELLSGHKLLRADGLKLMKEQTIAGKKIYRYQLKIAASRIVTLKT